jgi:pyruvate kinase
MISGMNVARLNFSHGDHEYHLSNMNRIRSISAELGKPVAIMLDTRGPEIRLELFEDHKVELKKGQTFTLCTETISGTAERASITYKELPRDIREGTTILIDDDPEALENEEYEIVMDAMEKRKKLVVDTRA